jgi:hypothetical protein
MAIKFNRSQTFSTNGTVTAAGLHNLIDGTDIYQALITDQPSLTAVDPADSILIADASLTAGDAPRQTTVSNLFDDALTGGTYTNLNLAGSLTFGTAIGNRTISTSATITTGTIPNLTSSTASITIGTIPTLTAGTTTSTAVNITNGTIQTLTASTATISNGTYSGAINSTSGTISTINSTIGTIGNLSTTLAGDFTISQGTGTASTATVAKLAVAQEYTAAHNFNATTLTSGNSIAWDLSSNQVTRLVLSTNGTMADTTNKVDGSTYILLVTQGTGSNTLAWNATYKWPGGIAPTLTTGSGKSDIFTFVSNGTNLFGVASQNY